jgi:poly-gamma-glutamate capsule biosynthesis protein CapA/YwtB (metallophosphatase superfamily)
MKKSRFSGTHSGSHVRSKSIPRRRRKRLGIANKLLIFLLSVLVITTIGLAVSAAKPQNWFSGVKATPTPTTSLNSQSSATSQLSATSKPTGITSNASSAVSGPSKPGGTSSPNASPEPTMPLKPIPTAVLGVPGKASIIYTGDVLMHDAIINGGLKANGTYDYNYLFADTKSLISGADYSITDFEGVMSGSPPYTGYPSFNAPDAIATAIKNAGYDMVTTANNHGFDKGFAAFKHTPTVFTDIGVKVIGSRPKITDPKFHIVNINGIKFGFSAYTYETKGTSTQRAVNSILIPAEANALLDSFNPYRQDRLAADKKGMAQRVRLMREAGAECVVFVMHWGDEYMTSSNTYQRDLARFLADEGVDIIFANHPHVIQEISVIASAKSGKKTPVYYSTGNFVSNMPYDANKTTNGKAEDGIIARIEAVRDNNGKITVTKAEYIGVYVYKQDIQGKRIHKVVPVRQYLINSSAYENFADKNLISASRKRINELLLPSTGIHNGILIGEYQAN